MAEFVLNKDYYLEKGKVIFTEEYLKNNRKICCLNECRHCPFKNNP